MKDHPPITHDRRTSRTEQFPAIPATTQQLLPGLGVRSSNTASGGRVPGIVIVAVEAIVAVEEIVRPVHQRQVRRLDQRARRVAVDECSGWGVRFGSEAVGFEGLEHQRRRVGEVAVTAGAAAAEAVAVDLVCDVAGAVRVEETGCVDGTALAVKGS